MMFPTTGYVPTLCLFHSKRMHFPGRLKPVALGHKNRLHFGSEAAGRNVAARTSVAETCKRNRINVRDYLQSVLPGLNEVIAKWAAELPPMAW